MSEFTYTLDCLRGEIKSLSDCCLKDGPDPEHVVEVLESCLTCSCGSFSNPKDCEDWCDHQSYAIVRMTDGQFGLFEEYSDTTGHG